MASDPEGTAVAGDGSAVVRLAAVLAAAAEAEASVAERRSNASGAGGTALAGRAVGARGGTR